jgi:rubrerythrin
MEKPIPESSTPEQLLEIALSRERSAVAFYEELLTRARDAMMRDLIAQMRDDETRHVRALERKLNELLDGRL